MPEKKRPKRLRVKLRPFDNLLEYIPPPTGDQVTATFIVKKKPEGFFGTPRKEDTARAVRRIIEAFRCQEEEVMRSLAGLVEILKEDKNGKK